MAGAEHSRLEMLRVRAEDTLRRLGGDELVADARSEAQWYVDLYFPSTDYLALRCASWDPIERVHARLMILTKRAERASATTPDRPRRAVPDVGR